ncbi:hypothetical protein B0J11DRAFT_506645 [Dendryphion nanum]|uniref:Uncharacterized protein n=1 Tax=Dendryphion nanum TaxID=256645 RepID=A0A9P9ILI6_9PLEO|nr:hypothetical protein B0J11DRAFT_506645 [Dendryphion nanum]
MLGNTFITVTAALALLSAPVLSLELMLCHDADLRGHCDNRIPMHTNGCYSSRSGTDWAGFKNDAITSLRVTNGCCDFFRNSDCELNSFLFKYCDGTNNNVGAEYNDKISSVSCTGK